jgi:hypothetical protein
MDYQQANQLARERAFVEAAMRWPPGRDRDEEIRRLWQEYMKSYLDNNRRK